MYNYQIEKQWISTLEGQRDMLRVRDWVKDILQSAGAFTLQNAVDICKAGDSFSRIACVDFLVELGEIEEVPGQTCASQYRIYRAKQ